MTTVLETIEQMDPVAKIPALRGVVHATLSRTIGAIRQSIRDNEPDGEAMANAKTFFSVYTTSLNELLKLTSSKWDMPLDFHQMLEFMSKPNPLTDEVASAIAAASGTDAATIKKLHEAQDLKDRTALEHDMPTIEERFKALTASKTKPKLTFDVEQQLAEKVANSLIKAKDQTMNRVMRTRRISDLSNLAVFDAAIKQIEAA